MWDYQPILSTDFGNNPKVTLAQAQVLAQYFHSFKINPIWEIASLILLPDITSDAIKDTKVTVRARRKSMSLTPSISFISAGGWGRLRPQQVGWWCDLAGLSVISGPVVLVPLFGLGYNAMWCLGPRGATVLLPPASLIKMRSPQPGSLDVLTLLPHFDLNMLNHPHLNTYRRVAVIFSSTWCFATVKQQKWFATNQLCYPLKLWFSLKFPLKQIPI